MTTYERVEELRCKEGISQGKLEKKIGLSNGQISKWKKNNPSAESLSKIANYFNVSIEYLLGSDTIEKDNEENIWNIDCIKEVLKDDELSKRLITYANKLLDLKAMEEQ